MTETKTTVCLTTLSPTGPAGIIQQMSHAWFFGLCLLPPAGLLITKYVAPPPLCLLIPVVYEVYPSMTRGNTLHRSSAHYRANTLVQTTIYILTFGQLKLTDLSHAPRWNLKSKNLKAPRRN